MLKKIIELPYVILEFIYKKFLIIIKFLFAEEKEGKVDFKATFKGILIALVLALIIRSLYYEPFYIPSGSMKPELKEGDFILVSKYDFGYSKYSFPLGLPLFDDRIFFNQDKLKRGDVMVFRLPQNPNINYIKRLIGLPGDKIQMKDGKLYINNQEISKTYIGKIEEYDNIPESKVKAYREVLQRKSGHTAEEFSEKYLNKLWNSFRDAEVKNLAEPIYPEFPQGYPEILKVENILKLVHD